MNRRNILKLLAGAAAAIIGGPLVAHASDQNDSAVITWKRREHIRPVEVQRWVIKYDQLTRAQAHSVELHWRGADLYRQCINGEWVKVQKL